MKLTLAHYYLKVGQDKFQNNEMSFEAAKQLLKPILDEGANIIELFYGLEKFGMIELDIEHKILRVK